MNLVADGETYELAVTDNGPGIEAEIREHLFSPFKTTKEGGTGLGLSTAARIAKTAQKAVDDAGLTIYPNGPDKPPYKWVFSFGLNTYAWGEEYLWQGDRSEVYLGRDATYGRCSLLIKERTK